jgi:hypothetical protein
MISAENAVQARELHAHGWTISAIARQIGHDRKTIRIYLTGARDPGQPRSETTDLFHRYDAYAARRLREDPHLSAAALHRELADLDYTGSYSALTRSLRQRGLLPDCPDCRKDRLPQFTKRASLLHHLHSHQGLPIRVAPVFGQTIASYLDQVATVHHLPTATLLAHLPTWFRNQYRAHDDLSGHNPAHLGDTETLARLTSNDPNVLLRALPSLAGWTRGPCTPLRSTTACRRCTLRRGITTAVPVHLPALQRICPHHRTWLGQTHQIDTTNCPDIVRSANRAARLARCHSPARILFAETNSRDIITRWLKTGRYPTLTRRWTTILNKLTAAGSLADIGSDHADLIAAATYSETVSLAAILLSPTSTAHAFEHDCTDLSARLIGSPRMATVPSPDAGDHLQ